MGGQEDDLAVRALFRVMSYHGMDAALGDDLFWFCLHVLW